MSKLKNNGTNKNRYLCFSLGVEQFAIPLLSAKEVLAVPEFTPIPHSAPYYVGVMNLRGQVVSVIDLRVKFNFKPTKSEETTVIIIDVGGQNIGVIVDSINFVIAADDNEIAPKPQVDNIKSTSDYVIGVYRRDENLVLFFDINKLLSAEDKTKNSLAKSA